MKPNRICRKAWAFRLLAAALLLLPLSAWAEAAEDAALKLCLENPANQSTAGMMVCLRGGIDRANQELTETYVAALRDLDPASATRLRQAQARWLAYRDAEHAAQRGPWQRDRGTMVGPEILHLEIAAIRQRIGEIRLYRQ